jgi:hypothetical protein
VGWFGSPGGISDVRVGGVDLGGVCVGGGGGKWVWIFRDGVDRWGPNPSISRGEGSDAARSAAAESEADAARSAAAESEADETPEGADERSEVVGSANPGLNKLTFGGPLGA